jgi:long-subunit fatty acid transport protein
MRLVGHRGLSLLVAVCAWAPAVAWAGGYDTPMLYSARHMGMGGTAIGSVDDPSALFHNPAGLGQVGRLSLIADFSLLLAKVHGSPAAIPQATDIDSRQTVAPLFLLGAGFRLNRIFTLGLGVFPIASAGATYRYPGGSSSGGTVEYENRTRLVFLEVTPALAVNLPGRVRLGAGYRITYVSLERFQGAPADPMSQPLLDFTMHGLNWAGFRVGAQWTATDWLQVGAVYRHRSRTRVTNDSGVAVQRFTDIETTFLLPSKLGGGARADLGPVGLGLDGEYLLNAQNDAYALTGKGTPTAENPSGTTAVSNVYDWKNELTMRAGVEYRLLPRAAGERGRLALRVGYVYDGKTTNAFYPSAFGTPPGPTHVFTGGVGWNAGCWQVNAAFARRQGSGAVTAADKAAAPRDCLFCSAAGKDPYRIGINGFYLDVGFAY